MKSGEYDGTTAGAPAAETLSLTFRIICDKSDDIFMEQVDNHARICEGPKISIYWLRKRYPILVNSSLAT